MANPKGRTKLKTHSILEDYEVSWGQKLGCGISGPVRPCKNKLTGVRHALKCLKDTPRAQQEVNLQLKCSGHPHIVSIFDVYANEVQFPGESEPKSRLLLVMEVMDGGELFDRISKQKYFTESQAANYTKQIVSAIHRCHSLNIAHRDIKPENLLLRDNLEGAPIKLADFGFAKVDDGSLMTPHFTPYYVAPQVLEAQKQQARERYCILPQSSPYTYDKSCDMWSLGVIIYIMLCGYPPFYSETPSKQITRCMKRKIMAGHFDFPVEEWGGISPLAKDLVSKLLQVDSAKRFTSDQVLQHPWLSEAPNTQLQSPAVMLDKNVMFEAQQAHSQYLTAMRLPDIRVTLKPLNQINNPILKKRTARIDGPLRPSSDDETPRGKTPAKVTSKTVAMQRVRDVIAHCILSEATDNAAFEPTLNDLVLCACHHHPDNLDLQRALQPWQWDGSKFLDKVDAPLLAHSLGEFLNQQSAAQTESTAS